MNGELGRRFGSIGLSITGFDTQVSARIAAHSQVIGVETTRAEALLHNILEGQAAAEAVCLEISRSAPAHAGLGSGTQLALAVAQAVSTVLGHAADATELASLTGRGRRSGIGIGAFRTGGFLVDGGHGSGTEVPPVISRLDFPEDWRFILVTDEADEGLSGQRERAAFQTLPAASASTSERICRVALMKLLPGILERDFAAVSESLRVIQDATGDYFAPSQGGRYTSAGVSQVLLALEQAGIHGIGQTSWGPTGFALVESEREAQRLLGEIGDKLALADSLSLHICKAVNTGARTEFSQQAAAPQPNHAQRV